LKRQQRHHQKSTEMSSSCKAKQCAAGPKAVDCSISASRHSRAVSGLGMCK